MRTGLIPLALSAFISTFPALAQDAVPAKTVLVLDASGSMWGQIEGEAKITIAQRVIGDLLDSLPPETQLGLSAYGHRVKGSCTDIEMLVPAGPDTRGAIREAVNAIKPKGKTPLSSAVIEAAKALKYEEDAATVILVSDGRETCDLDPCEVARQLEETGVGFTAHVIGFDITDADDRAQLQCLADGTGGRFLTASNAQELSEALEEVSVAPPPPPDPAKQDLRFLATDGTGGPVYTRGIAWTLTNLEDGATVMENFDIADLRIALAPGPYRATVTRQEDQATATLDITVADQGATHTLALPSSTPEATVEGPSTAIAGSTVAVQWTGPNTANDYISVDRAGDEKKAPINYTYTNKGTPLKLQMPPTPGTYEIRYILQKGRKVLARQTVEVTPVEAKLTLPSSATAGQTIVVQWEGPDYQNDYISVASPDQEGARQINYTYTNRGNPTKLLMPPEPGTYEVRYIMDQDRTILASQTIEVTDVQATLTAPAQAQIGSTVTVQWTGPDYPNDYISVATPDQIGARQINYTYTNRGNPMKLQMPPEPGTYEIRYILDQDRVILASTTIEVVEAAVTIEAPATAVAGSNIAVTWTGPDAQNDYIAVAKPDSRGNQQINYTYTRDGSPLKLQMPVDPGTYEVRYILSQDRTVLASTQVEVTAVSGTLDAPAEAPAGSTVVVNWTGPDYQNDYISVAKTDSRGNQQVNYTYTRDGSPLKLQMPPTPGDYEIRYIISQDRQILFSQPITVTPVTASLSTPTEAPAGSNLIVQWEGPDYQNDYIAVSKVNSRDNQQVNYTYTREGSPLKLVMPPNPGTYELRYVQSQDRTVLARETIEISEVTAVLDAPGTGPAGGQIRVDWVGPDYQNDYISIAKVNAKDNKYETFTYTRQGSPLIIKMPKTPGTYEIRYVMRQGNRVLERAQLVVE
jgi:Ca-activated chloride channel family protein